MPTTFEKKQGTTTFTLTVKDNGKVDFQAKDGNKVFNTQNIDIKDLEKLESFEQIRTAIEAFGYNQKL